ncbi:MAG TPA: hypothetical protein PKW15_00915 [Alphaproteobacteria bacterium]|nr:hypothetical protein [Rhodospirillaceae bacterium]HRJ11784.1 hypothetical protein [Alphaproteobacteria bacterium]
MTRNLTLLAAGLLLFSHPMMTWMLNDGYSRIIELALYFLFCQTLHQLMLHGDVRSIINTAVCFALMLIGDARLIYVAAIAVPFLALVAPPDMIKTSRISFFLIILFPAIAMVLSYLYINHIVATIPFGVMQMIGSSVPTILPDFKPITWQYTYGGELPWPPAQFLVTAVASFPLAILAPVWLRRERLLAVPIFISALVPLIASIVTLYAPFTDYPATMLMLLWVPTALASYAFIMRGRGMTVIVMLILGWLGSTLVLSVPGVLS